VKGVVWTVHANVTVQKRAIPREWVSRCLEKPDWTELDPTHSGRIRAYKRFPEFGERVMRVVFEEAGEHFTVVTVLWDRNAGRRK
jgi:hypothetical protein